MKPQDYWPKDVDIDNPDFEHQIEPEDGGIPWYIWLIIIVGLAALFFDAGKSDSKPVNDPMKARMDALKHPISYSLPEDYLGMTGERDQITNNQGEK